MRKLGLNEMEKISGGVCESYYDELTALNMWLAEGSITESAHEALYDIIHGEYQACIACEVYNVCVQQ